MIKPTFQFRIEKETPDYGVFIFEPLQQGYGQTLGNSLRRVLLSSMPGAAIVQVKISGVKHLFSTLKGMKEDIVEFTLNLKKVRINYSGDKPVKITLEKTGPGKITAADFKVPSGVEIVNKDQVLGTLADKNAKLKGEFIVESGFGYIPFEERESSEIGVIPLDAIFTPVKRVNYHVSATRVGRVTNFDRLNMEVWTDGTIAPKDAVLRAAETLSSFFNQIVNPQEVEEEVEEVTEYKAEEPSLTIEELELPTRIVNALLKVGVRNVADIQKAGRKKISKVKNLGGKSLKIIEAALVEKGVELKD
ncbi:DNA-directed RNA polymerase subunit alpha [Candidatus Microgenomates bacterium]|jgi:DNA-directed RNA polymerase subunit alpha|nr:MAG: DNA-directed RNA polymerase subunit alpha [Candidatus Microgenomates bacterium]